MIRKVVTNIIKFTSTNHDYDHAASFATSIISVKITKKTIITTIDHLQWCLCENVEVEVNVAFHTRALLKKKPHLHRHYGDIISWLIIIIMLSIMIIIMSSKIVIIWSLYCDIMVSPHHSCRSSWRNGELSSAAARGLPAHYHDDHIIIWSWWS